MKRILTLLHCILILGCVTFLGCVIFFQGCQKGNKTSLRQYTVVVEAGPKGSVYMNGRHFLFLGKTLPCLTKLLKFFPSDGATLTFVRR